VLVIVVLAAVMTVIVPVALVMHGGRLVGRRRRITARQAERWMQTNAGWA